MTGILLFLVGCSVTRHVPEGKYLLNKTDISIESDTVKRNLFFLGNRDIGISGLRNYVRQNPNARWFNLFRLPLGIYSLSGRDSSLWVNRVIRAIGEQPVLYDSIKARQTRFDLQQQLRNKGYLRSYVEIESHKHGKKIDINYKLYPGDPYFVKRIQYHIADTNIARLLEETGDSAHRLLYEGMKFDAELLNEERNRITTLLTNHGYYRFHKEFITYTADTVLNSRLIDIDLYLQAYSRQGHSDTLHSQYYIRNINYVNGDNHDDRIHLRHHVLEECTHLAENEPYSASALQNTYNHFGRLQAVKYTNIAFDNPSGTNLLDCNIQLQTNKPSTLSFQPEGTNTAGDLGAAASLTYQNRNLFRGSELLSIELRGAYEAIKGLEGYSQQDFKEYSLETKLAFPRFIIPFLSHDLRRVVNATSEVSILYDLQNRPEYHRQVLSVAWRYRWNFPNRRDRFQLDLLDLNYVFMPWISSTFQHEYLDSESNRNAILRYNYEDLYITKLGIGYSYNNNIFALKTNLETSGNVLSMGASLLGKEKDDEGHYRFLNIAFAQYIKGDIDLTRSLQIDANNQLVFHLGFGIAYPYGNSSILPFEKRYFSGGANSVRGWSVRSLGPGKYKELDGRINFINQTGDMKLDLNTEYRTHLFWKLGVALFVDAGNIWTLRNYDFQPGGQFRFDTFLSQLAVSYGMGFRFNFDYFILRFDLGMKAINPSYEVDDEEHFPVIHPRFGRDFAFHFAVGLPF